MCSSAFYLLLSPLLVQFLTELACSIPYAPTVHLHFIHSHLLFPNVTQFPILCCDIHCTFWNHNQPTRSGLLHLFLGRRIPRRKRVHWWCPRIIPWLNVSTIKMASNDSILRWILSNPNKICSILSRPCIGIGVRGTVCGWVTNQSISLRLPTKTLILQSYPDDCLMGNYIAYWKMICRWTLPLPMVRG